MTGKTTIKRAMVLGAGKGTRMRELTEDRPKPIVEVGGRPLVDHVLDRLSAAGVTNVIVNVHYKADVLERHLSFRSAPCITISDERDVLLDTGGGVVKALEFFGENPFFIHNADSIWIEHGASAFEVMMNTWNPDEMDALLMLADPASALGYKGAGDFILGDDGRLSRCEVGKCHGLVFAGVSVAQPSLFSGAPTGAFSLNLLWDRAIEAGRTYGVCLDGQWMHVGTPEAVDEASAVLARGGPS